jgi:hypothetical protein
MIGFDLVKDQLEGENWARGNKAIACLVGVSVDRGVTQ